MLSFAFRLLWKYTHHSEFSELFENSQWPRFGLWVIICQCLLCLISFALMVFLLWLKQLRTTPSLVQVSKLFLPTDPHGSFPILGGFVSGSSKSACSQRPKWTPGKFSGLICSFSYSLSLSLPPLPILCGATDSSYLCLSGLLALSSQLSETGDSIYYSVYWCYHLVT